MLSIMKHLMLLKALILNEQYEFNNKEENLLKILGNSKYLLIPLASLHYY